MTLEERVQRLEDIEAIKQLKATYCYAADEGDVDGVARLFTEDAVWEGEGMGRFEGREAIRGFFADLPKRLSFAIHQVMNPRIQVHGDIAHGDWYLLEPNTTSRGEMAVWGAGRYRERYARVDGEWKLAELRLTPLFWTPYDEGWAKVPSILR